MAIVIVLLVMVIRVILFVKETSSRDEDLFFF